MVVVQLDLFLCVALVVHKEISRSVCVSSHRTSPLSLRNLFLNSYALTFRRIYYTHTHTHAQDCFALPRRRDQQHAGSKHGGRRRRKQVTTEKETHTHTHRPTPATARASFKRRGDPHHWAVRVTDPQQIHTHTRKRKKS